jgi:hypothetical protein
LSLRRGPWSSLTTSSPSATRSRPLATLAAEVVALKDALRVMVADQQGITCSAPDGNRQIRPEVAAYERALERAGRILTDTARLGLEERFVRLSTAHGEQIAEVIEGALGDLGVAPEREAVRLAVAGRLRAVAGGGTDDG